MKKSEILDWYGQVWTVSSGPLFIKSDRRSCFCSEAPSTSRSQEMTALTIWVSWGEALMKCITAGSLLWSFYVFSLTTEDKYSFVYSCCGLWNYFIVGFWTVYLCILFFLNLWWWCKKQVLIIFLIIINLYCVFGCHSTLDNTHWVCSTFSLRNAAYPFLGTAHEHPCHQQEVL